MQKAGRTGQKILKIIHIFFAGLWIGGAIALWLMVLCLPDVHAGEELYGYAMSVKFLDDLIIVPGALGTLVSGVIVSVCTGWGFFKHPFVIVKLVLTVVCIFVGIVVLGPTVNGQPPLIQELGILALEEETFAANRMFCLLGGGVQLLAILFMLSISTLKPWGRRKKAIAA